MRLVTFTDGGGPARLGIWSPDDTIIDPRAVLQADASLEGRGGSAALEVPTEMVAFFESGASGRAAAEAAVQTAARRTEAGDELRDSLGNLATLTLEQVTLLAPVPRPRRVRDYLTYPAHAAGSGLAVPPAFAAMPICYKCNVESIVGPDTELLWPCYTEQLDFEMELGFYTGGGGRNLRPDEASKLIAGVTIFNDVSARDVQMFEMSLSIGPSKGKDFCTAMGPCVLTIDEVDEWAVEMTARVNGEVWASGTTKERQFSFAEVLAWASLSEDVYPGEFLGLGTVGGGCGLELDRWINPGDLVELEATGVGVLRNRVGKKEAVPEGAGLATYDGAPAVHVQPHP